MGDLLLPLYVIVQCVPLSLLTTAQDEWTALRLGQPAKWVQLREDNTVPSSKSDVAVCFVFSLKWEEPRCVRGPTPICDPNLVL
jgi:hypothetical protein